MLKSMHIKIIRVHTFQNKRILQTKCRALHLNMVNFVPPNEETDAIGTITIEGNPAFFKI